MMAKFVCLACGKEKYQSPRSAGRQSYCSDSACQRARKAAWQRRSLANDPDYRRNQRLSHATWCRDNPNYWKEYRSKNPEKAELNRKLQRKRNRLRPHAKAQASEPLIAKMDALTPSNSGALPDTGEYWMIPIIAKMDAFRVKILKVPDD